MNGHLVFSEEFLTSLLSILLMEYRHPTEEESLSHLSVYCLKFDTEVLDNTKTQPGFTIEDAFSISLVIWNVMLCAEVILNYQSIIQLLLCQRHLLLKIIGGDLYDFC